MSDSELPLETSCGEVEARLDSADDLVLVDCREPAEMAIVRIEGALPLPMSELPAGVARLEAHRDLELVVYCHHGSRSLQLALWLREQGFPRVQSMAGGIDQWAVQIDGDLPRY